MADIQSQKERVQGNRKIQNQKENTKIEDTDGKSIEVRESKEYTARHLNARHFLPKNCEIVTTGTRIYRDKDGLKWPQWFVRIKHSK